jgi:hypothetical protein
MNREGNQKNNFSAIKPLQIQVNTIFVFLIKKKMVTKQERLLVLITIRFVYKSGFGGILEDGSIVDRRKFPQAVLIGPNTQFGIPKIRKLPDLNRTDELNQYFSNGLTASVKVSLETTIR